MYDVIVVGARVAGAPTAMLFARAGYRVLLLDRASFPSDTLSTHYIHQPGVARLARWGVLDAVRATGCPPLERTVYRAGDVRLTGCGEAVDGQHAAYAPRRHLLDKILIDAAVAAGVEFRENCSVSGPLFDGDRVAGVEACTERGTAVREHAVLTVGADGMRSGIAKGVGAPYVVEDPLQSCIHYTYWEGLETDFELYEEPGRWIGAVPTNDGATMIAAYRRQSEFARIRGEAGRYYLENIRETAPELYARAERGRQIEPLRGTGDQRNFFRQPSGDGWALVGDAAHHKDSITARGISDAFLQCDLLAESVGDRLHDPAHLATALEGYAERLLDDLFEGYRNTLFVSRLELTAERRETLRLLASSSQLTDRYFSAAAGTIGVDELYDESLHASLAR
jgi:flavin-dependent dehydrogenase